MKKMVQLFGKVLGNARAVSKQKSSKRDGGFTAIELFVVIIVGLAILIAAVSNIGKLFSGSSNMEESRSLQELVVGVKKVREPTGYPANLVTVLHQADLLPKSLTYNATTGLKNSWDAAITLTGTTVVTIAYSKADKEQCNAVFSKVGTMGIFKTIKIDATTVTLPAAADAVATACNSLTDSKAIELVMK